MENNGLQLKNSICFNYFHVPGTDEKSLFRRGVVDAVSGELTSLGEPLNSPTVCWSKKSEALDFLSSNPALNIIKSEMPRDFFIGEIALFAGWFLALNAFLLTDYAYLLIFEDDLWFNCKENAALNQLKKVTVDIPENTDIVFLFSPEENFEKYTPKLDVSQLFCTNYSNWSTAFTLVTKKGASKILTLFERGINRPLDALLLGDTGIVKYSLKPEEQAPYFSVYDRTWIGSQIDPSFGLVPKLLITEEDMINL